MNFTILRAVVWRIFLEAVQLASCQYVHLGMFLHHSGWRKLACNSSEFFLLPDNLRAGKRHVRHLSFADSEWWMKMRIAASVACAKREAGLVQSDVSCARLLREQARELFDSFC